MIIDEELSSMRESNRFEIFARERLRVFKDQFQDPVKQVFPPANELKISYPWKKAIIFIIDILLSLELIRDSMLVNDLKGLRRYLIAKRKWKSSALKFESIRDYHQLASSERVGS